MSTLTPEIAAKILRHLEATRQAFCFYQGALVSQDDCELVLDGGEVDLF